MKITMDWNEGMALTVKSVEGHQIHIDAKSPIGKGSAMTPKELVLVGMGGCTAMDVLALLRKHKQPFESLNVEVEVETTKGVHPAVFTEGTILFNVTGSVDRNLLNEAVLLSQTQYCGVNAMLAQSFPIKYVVRLNNEEIGTGLADFQKH